MHNFAFCASFKFALGVAAPLAPYQRPFDTPLVNHLDNVFADCSGRFQVKVDEPSCHLEKKSEIYIQNQYFKNLCYGMVFLGS